MVGVWVIFFWIGDFMVVDEVLDFVFEAGIIVDVMAFLLVELAILAKVEVTWHGVW